MGVFQFKKFSVCDDRATMKVGTDAVLLGAWSDVDRAKNILDIGSGSGVISLMMAQRSDSDSRIDAIELLADDAKQSSENILNSPWPLKISVTHTSIQNFLPETKYDLIICNPPFFTNSLLPPVETRSKVRHDTTLTLDELLAATVRLLSPIGKFCVILPAIESEIFIEKAKSKKLFLHHLTRFYSRADKPQERSLMEMTFVSAQSREDSLILHQSKDQWTNEYKALTKEFYLDR